MKIEQYVMVEKEGHYLHFKQISENEIEVTSTTNIENATTWRNDDSNSWHEINQQAFNMIKEIGDFTFSYLNCDKPNKIVKVLKLIHIEESVNLSIYS